MKSSGRVRFSAIPSSVAIQLFVAFFVIYAITSSGGLEDADSEMRYRTAQSWLDGEGGALPLSLGPIAVPGRGGREFSFYGPLQSVLMTPFVALSRLVARANAEHLFKLVFGVLVIPAISALSLAILFRALRALRFAERAAFCAVVVIGLATPLWHYGRSGQEENIIGLAFALYLWGMALLFRNRFEGLMLIALTASIIVATRWSYLPTLFIILIPVAWLLWQRRADWGTWWRNLVIGSALASAVAGMVFWYNTYRFGRPFETGYGVYYNQLHPPFFTFAATPSHMAALMFSPYRGIIWFCPALLVLVGLRNVAKGSPYTRLWKATLGAWLFTWIFIASYSVWNAGAAWGPRFFVALIVLLAPAFAAVFGSGQRWRALIAISLLVQFCSTVLPSSSEDFVYDVRNLAHPGDCNPWSCDCTALCLRGPWALRAIGNTIASRPLPVIDLNSSAKTPGGASPLATSDFNSVYWWPVRAAYRARKLSPSLAFALCMLVLSAAFCTLWFCYRRLPVSPSAARPAS